jgi:hypothetical protein
MNHYDLNLNSNSMEDIIDEEPLYTYKRISRPSVRNGDQSFTNLLSIESIDNIFQIDYKEISHVYKHKFFKKSRSLNTIYHVFSEAEHLKIINYFAIYTVISHNDKLTLPKQHITDQLDLQINVVYKRILSKLRCEDIGCFSLSLFIGYFVSHYLIRFQFFDKQSDSLNFLYYCVEIVHMRLNGFALNSNMLFKYISEMFAKLYEMKKERRTIINLSLPQSQFEQQIGFKNHQKSINQLRPKYQSDSKIFWQSISDKCFLMNRNYQEVSDEFVKVMKNYIQSQANSNEHYISSSNLNHRFRNNFTDLNGLGNALRSNTPNPKKPLCITFKTLHKKAISEIQKSMKNLNDGQDTLFGQPVAEKSVQNCEDAENKPPINKELRLALSKDSVSKKFKEKSEILNLFEKDLRTLDFKLEKIQRSKSFVNSSGANRDAKLHHINNEFKMFSQFFNQMRQDKEQERVKKHPNEFLIKNWVNNRNDRPSINPYISRTTKAMDQKDIDRLIGAPPVVHRNSTKKNLQSFLQVKTRGSLSQQMQKILNLNPSAN